MIKGAIAQTEKKNNKTKQNKKQTNKQKRKTYMSNNSFGKP